MSHLAKEMSRLFLVRESASSDTDTSFVSRRYIDLQLRNSVAAWRRKQSTNPEDNCGFDARPCQW